MAAESKGSGTSGASQELAQHLEDGKQGRGGTGFPPSHHPGPCAARGHPQGLGPLAGPGTAAGQGLWRARFLSPASNWNLQSSQQTSGIAVFCNLISPDASQTLAVRKYCEGSSEHKEQSNIRPKRTKPQFLNHLNGNYMNVYDFTWTSQLLLYVPAGSSRPLPLLFCARNISTVLFPLLLCSPGLFLRRKHSDKATLKLSGPDTTICSPSSKASHSSSCPSLSLSVFYSSLNVLEGESFLLWQVYSKIKHLSQKWPCPSLRSGNNISSQYSSYS